MPLKNDAARINRRRTSPRGRKRHITWQGRMEKVGTVRARQPLLASPFRLSLPIRLQGPSGSHSSGRLRARRLAPIMKPNGTVPRTDTISPEGAPRR